MRKLFCGCWPWPAAVRLWTGGRAREAGAFLLDTAVSVRIYEGGGRDTAQAALDLCASYEKIFSRTDPDSELYRLNHREITQVSDELAQVIALGLDYGRSTGGAFDITMGAVSELWDFAAEDPALPDGEEVARRLAHTGWETVSVEGNTVTFADPETVIDLEASPRLYRRPAGGLPPGGGGHLRHHRPGGEPLLPWAPGPAGSPSRWGSNTPMRSGRPPSAVCPPKICR